MITSHNFNQANQQYQQSLIPYRLLQEQAQVMLGICANPPSEITTPLSITHEHIQWLTQQAESDLSYMGLFGGDMHICEQEIDLQQIHGCDFTWAETHDDSWPNVTDIAMSWDVCCYLDELKDEPQWVMFLLCWNDAGGPIYYVPKHLWDAARITEHITATNDT